MKKHRSSHLSALASLIIFSCFLILASCNKDHEASDSSTTSAEDNSNLRTGQPRGIVRLKPDGSHEFIIPVDVIRHSMEQAFDAGTVIDEVELLQKADINDNPVYVIEGRGSNNGGTRMINVHLVRIDPPGNGETGTIMVAAGADKCTGDPCNKCKLVGKVGDQSCTCEGDGKDGKPGFCNHETGGTFVIVPKGHTKK